MEIFAERLKELRQEKRLSQAQLAEYLVVSQKAIDYWERGVNEPKADYLKRIALFFNVSTDYLVGIKDN